MLPFIPTEEYKCANGFKKCRDNRQCLKIELFCDGKINCNDLSDERGCGKSAKKN